MLVICNGMPRSASTWCYNVILGLMRQSLAGEVFGGYSENLEQFLQTVPPSASHAVVKCHSLSATGLRIAQLGGAKVVYSWRDLADAIASQMVMFQHDFDQALSIISISLDLYHEHRRHGALILEYGNILAESGLWIREIADYLELEVTTPQLDALADATSLASMRAKVAEIGSRGFGPKLARHDGLTYDPATLLHVDHIRDGGVSYGRRLLTEDQLGQIAALLREKDLLDMQSWLSPSGKRLAKAGKVAACSERSAKSAAADRPFSARLLGPLKIFARRKGADSA